MGAATSTPLTRSIILAFYARSALDLCCRFGFWARAGGKPGYGLVRGLLAMARRDNIAGCQKKFGRDWPGFEALRLVHAVTPMPVNGSVLNAFSDEYARFCKVLWVQGAPCFPGDLACGCANRYCSACGAARSSLNNQFGFPCLKLRSCSPS